MLQPGLFSAKTTVIGLKKKKKPEQFLPNSRTIKSATSTDEVTCRVANDQLKTMCFFFFPCFLTSSDN